jgi:hypothetical protein
VTTHGQAGGFSISETWTSSAALLSRCKPPEATASGQAFGELVGAPSHSADQARHHRRSVAGGLLPKLQAQGRQTWAELGERQKSKSAKPGPQAFSAGIAIPSKHGSPHRAQGPLYASVGLSSARGGHPAAR